MSIKPSLLVAIVFFLLTACNQGYKKQETKWVWISYQSGSKSVTEIDQHDFNSFTILENKDYAIDKNSVFYLGRIIKNADPKNFNVLNNGYSKDLNYVFLDAETVVLADSETFEQLDFPYSRDRNRVFCGTIPLDIKKSEIQDFVVTNENEAMSTLKTTILLSYFIEKNPEYKWLDTLNIDAVIIGEWATGQTKERRFKGFKEHK